MVYYLRGDCWDVSSISGQTLVTHHISERVAGAQMLKDILKQLDSESTLSSRCKVGRIYQEMEPDTAEAFKDVMCGGASTMDITRALNSEGISVRRELIGEKRACFRGENPACCMNEEEKK